MMPIPRGVVARTAATASLSGARLFYAGRTLPTRRAACAASPAVLVTPCRAFSLSSMNPFAGGGGGGKTAKVAVDNNYDTQTPHFRGKILGLPGDDVVFYGKVIGGALVVLVVFYGFFRGYALLTSFSLQAVAKMGFVGGFFSCMVLYSVAITCVRRYRINRNAVYNQSIAMVMSNEKVRQVLGSHPRTGDFKAYSATGGFRLPLAHRLRGGNYELKDLLGLKPRRLRMLFVLKNADGTREGLVACDVRRETTGLLTSTNVFKSLTITLSESGGGVRRGFGLGKDSDLTGSGAAKAKAGGMEAETIILVGGPEDVIHHKLIL